LVSKDLAVTPDAADYP